MSALGHRSVHNSDLTRLQQGMIKFEQIGAAYRVDQHRSMFNRPVLRIHAIAIAADRKANHAWTKRLKQHLGVARVVAEIRNNESIVIIAAIDRGERAGTRTSVKSLRQLLGLLDAD